MNSLSINQIEYHLDAGHIEVAMQHGKWWRVRRNGKTRLWKTRPTHFRIPVKFGLTATGCLQHDNLHWFRVAPDVTSSRED